MKKIDFETAKPDFDNGTCKWYIEKDLQRLIDNEQDENLPKLKNFGCFVVKGNGISDLVLIDNKQTVIRNWFYTADGFAQMEFFIKMLKISQHYDEQEGINV